MAAPTYPHAALGFRVWRTKDQLLLPLAGGTAWQPGVNKSICLPGPITHCPDDGHEAPGEKCHCGFNAYHHLDRAYQTAWEYLERGYDLYRPREYIREYTIVVGAIAGRGRVQIHSQGFRCQEAQILALSLVREDQPLAEQAATAARRYRVPLLPNSLNLWKQAEASPGVGSIPKSAWAPSLLHRLVFKH